MGKKGQLCQVCKREGRGDQQFVAASYAKAEGAVDLDGLSLGG